MLHSNTERLIDYWRQRKRGDLCPARHAIDPSELSLLLPQVFILGRTAPGRCVFRLAGGLVADIHGRDMRYVDMLSLWTETDRPRLASALEASRRAAEPLVATVEARSAQGAVQIELTFAPLAADAAPHDRFLGLYQPLESLSPLRALPAELRLRHIASAPERIDLPRIRLAAVDGRRIA
jgi:hypothetical protein